ncbi:MAG: archaeal proteasome endopeptidase complex subunit beta [Candidatus Micrarchaeia archaeon]|jgi:proteasome beta subunit
MDGEPKFAKGTTTVGIVFKDGVVVAADKRATMGNLVQSKTVNKIIPVSDRMAVTIAGGVGDAQSLSRVLKAELELYKYSRGAPASVQGAATLLANILQGSKYFPYYVGLILAGFDDSPKLFDFDPFGGLLEHKYVSTGSGSVTAYGVLDEYYKEGMTRDEAVKLAARAVNAAIKRDVFTGEGIDVVYITEKEMKRLSPQEVAALLK